MSMYHEIEPLRWRAASETLWFGDGPQGIPIVMVSAQPLGVWGALIRNGKAPWRQSLPELRIAICDELGIEPGWRPPYHEKGCECAPENVYRCSHCGRLFGYCHGGHSDDDTDEENEACDECWWKMKEGKGDDS